jgi:hypothetical protein
MEVGLGLELTGSKDNRKYNANNNNFNCYLGAVVDNKGTGGKYKYSPNITLNNNKKNTFNLNNIKYFLVNYDIAYRGSKLYLKKDNTKYEILYKEPKKNSNGFLTQKQKQGPYIVLHEEIMDEEDFADAWKIMRNGWYSDEVHIASNNNRYLLEFCPFLFIKKDFDFLALYTNEMRFDASNLWTMGSLSFGARGCQFSGPSLKKSGIPKDAPPIWHQNSPIILGVSLGYKFFGLIIEAKIIELVSSYFSESEPISPALRFGICIVTRYCIIKIGWDFEHKSFFISFAAVYTINVMGNDKIPRENLELRVTKDHKVQRMSQYTAY